MSVLLYALVEIYFASSMRDFLPVHPLAQPSPLADHPARCLYGDLVVGLDGLSLLQQLGHGVGGLGTGLVTVLTGPG